METGELRPLSCLEYDIDMDGMRETALKYQLEDGLPAGKLRVFKIIVNIWLYTGWSGRITSIVTRKLERLSY